MRYTSRGSAVPTADADGSAGARAASRPPAAHDAAVMCAIGKLDVSSTWQATCARRQRTSLRVRGKGFY